MSDQADLIAQINALTQLSRERELTPQETEQRQALRDRYLLGFRQNFRQQLDNTFVQKDDGEKVPLRDWRQTVELDAQAAFGDADPDA